MSDALMLCYVCVCLLTAAPKNCSGFVPPPAPPALFYHFYYYGLLLFNERLHHDLTTPARTLTGSSVFIPAAGDSPSGLPQHTT